VVRDSGEGILANHLMDDVHLVRFEPGRIELRVTEAAPANLASRFAAVLEQACGRRWVITISQQEGEATLRAQQKATEDAKRAAAMRTPWRRPSSRPFPEAKLVARRDRRQATPGPRAPQDPIEAEADEGADER
jgi:DNA polymerase III subunit gamma/tau